MLQSSSSTRRIFFFESGGTVAVLSGGTNVTVGSFVNDCYQVANEAIVNIRTVASLTREPKFLSEYKGLIDVSHK